MPEADKRLTMGETARWLIAKGIPFHVNKSCWHRAVFPAGDAK